MKKVLFTLILMLSLSLNAQPNLDWALNLGSSNSKTSSLWSSPFQYSRGFTFDSNNNMYVVGSFSGTHDFDPNVPATMLTSAGNEDIFISKYNSQGSLIWVKQIGGSDYDYANDIEIDNSGNLYITGSFSGSNIDFNTGTASFPLTSNGLNDIFVLKIDTVSNFIFAFNIGGSGEDHAHSIEVKNNIYIAGSFNSSSIDFDPTISSLNKTNNGDLDAFLASYSLNGNVNWAFNLGGNSEDGSLNVEIDNKENIILSTYLKSTSADFDPGIGIQNVSSNGTGYDACLSKFDSTGKLLWLYEHNFSTTGAIYSVNIDQNNNIYYGGSFKGTFDANPGIGSNTLTSFSSSPSDGFLVKINENGIYQWGFSLNNTTSSPYYFKSIATFGNAVYVTGIFSNVLDLDPGIGANSVNTNGLSDIFISKFDSSGSLNWAFAFGGSQKEYPCNLGLDPDGNLFLSGYFDNTVDFDPKTPVFSLNATSNSGFIAKYHTSVVSLDKIKNTNLVVYPNPANDFVYLENDNFIDKTVFIYDLLGKLILSQEISNDGIINVNDLKSGVYVLQITSQNVNYNTKLVIQK